jgi:nucleoside-diphosphate-sugar epimerase
MAIEARGGLQPDVQPDATDGPVYEKALAAMYAGKCVLVTGGGGFLGSHLCRALVSLGAQVHAAGRTPPPTATPNPHWHAADMSIMPAVEQALEVSRPDVVFHLAGDAVGSRELSLVSRSVQGELIPTINMLTAIAQRGAGRLVLAASLEEPLAANAVPSSPYAAAKWAGTGFARMFHLLYGTPVVITRPFMTYGPGQRSDKLVPHVIRALLRNEPPRLSSGRRMVDWVYVDDLIRGLLLAGSLDGIEGEELDLGSGQLVSVRAVVEQLVQVTGSAVSPEFGALPDRPHEIERRADAVAAHARIGWRAETTLEDGLNRTVAWCRTQKSE